MGKLLKITQVPLYAHVFTGKSLCCVANHKQTLALTRQYNLEEAPSLLYALFLPL